MPDAHIKYTKFIENFSEKNGLLASLDKERKEKLIKKGNQINKELQDKLSFIKVAEKVISKQDEIIELQAYISKIVHDFEEVSKNSTPNELRNEMDKLEKAFLEKMENGIFTLSLTESAGEPLTEPPPSQARNHG